MENLSRRMPKFSTSVFRTTEGEDHLGIRSVGISMADHLQSGITSITPRARYWSFFAWVLHDFIQNFSGDKSIINFKDFLKKQEWFYILANIADAEANGVNTKGVIGSTQGQAIWKKPKDLFEPDASYIQNNFGGYSTYRNVMKIVGITMTGDENLGVHIDRLTKPLGENLANVFKKSIEDTIYFQEYRLTDDPIPRSVLKQYGTAASLNRLKEDNSRDYQILSNIFIPVEARTIRQEYRKNSLLYFMTIIDQSPSKKMNFEFFQNIMYDGLFLGELTIPRKLHSVAIGWEIYQARQYFTFSLDTIWSISLEKISKKIMSKSDLIIEILNEVEAEGCNITLRVKDLYSRLSITKEQRAELIKKMKNEKWNYNDHLYGPLKILIEVSKRLQNRKDFEDSHNEMLGLGGRDSISFNTWFEFLDFYKEKSVREFLEHILRYFILEQHQKVALNKMITTSNETYHFIENDGKLFYVCSDNPTFNTFRVFQGLSILEDLGFLVSSEGKYQVTPTGRVQLNAKN